MLQIAHLAIDEFDIVGTLSVAITSPVLSTSLIGGVLGQTTVCVHLNEINSTVETARKVGHVDIECELLVLHVEHEIVGVVVHKVDTGADVRVRALRNEVEAEGVTGGRDTVDTTVIRSIESTVLKITAQ